MTWEEVRRRVGLFFDDVVGRLETYSSGGRLGEPVNVFFYSLGGRSASVLSRFERLVVTVLGSEYTLSFFEPFASVIRPAGYPWSGWARFRSGWEGYFRAVPCGKTLNAAQRRDLVRAYRKAGGGPAKVLTIQGRDFETRELAPGLLWHGPSESWRIVAGDPAAYRRFTAIVLEVGVERRQRFWAAVNALRTTPGTRRGAPAASRGVEERPGAPQGL